MENVTDETSNPFGMRVSGDAVYGYGDANADFHVVGDHPGVHGGAETGVPFTNSVAGRRLQRVLHDAGFAGEVYADEPTLSNGFLSYAHPRVPDGEVEAESYRDCERFLDAELRAINAHVLLPVGDAPLDYCLREHTTQYGRLPADADALHAEEVRGRGFMVVPAADPRDWGDGEAAALRRRLSAILESDYRQTKGVATTVG